jgi:hypothetical protein
MTHFGYQFFIFLSDFWFGISIFRFAKLSAAAGITINKNPRKLKPKMHVIASTHDSKGYGGNSVLFAGFTMGICNKRVITIRNEYIDA